MKRYIISEYAHDAPPLLRDFLVYISTIKGKSERTAYEYFLDLRFFLRYLLHSRKFVPLDMPFEEIPLQAVDVDFLKTITLSDVYDYLGYIAQERPRQQNSPHTEYGLCATSRARKVASLRAFFKYLTVKAGVLEVNPVSELDSPSLPKKLPRYLTLEDSKTLLESVSGPYAARDYCILTLFLNCGMRVSELAGMNLQDIQNDTLRVLGKGNKERTIYLNDACLEAIAAYLPERIVPHPADQNAFFTSRNRNRLSIPTIKWLVKKYLTAAGLDAQKYSAHKLRHTAATLMYQNGVDIRTLQTVLGHTNVDTTMIYTHIQDENVRAAAQNNPLASVRRKASPPDDTP
ncbi:tyrosine recombinase XerC [Intestinibacillus sp. Marseille-P6563]|uniref:tyrosine recombinase XerC n=1 Tax=Intestinibacillus sp. Marseille-P6563 TaxID=2364792 RepID=UPI000F05105C|nr:tyrosine recombinase XerC [Intestinibacillus sp. Marseille-P6563]